MASSWVHPGAGWGLNTTLCYIQRLSAEGEQQYLMLHRIKKENDVNHDKWIGVGGKFEQNESPEECMLREAREETGLTLTKWRYRGIVTFVSDQYQTEYMHLFTARDWVGTLAECEEGTLEWISREQFLALPQWEGDRIFLNLLDTDEPFFSLKLQYQGERLVQAVLNGKAVQWKR